MLATLREFLALVIRPLQRALYLLPEASSLARASTQDHHRGTRTSLA